MAKLFTVALIATLASCQSGPEPVAGHRGPVSDITVVAGQVLSCSQAAVQMPTGWHKPPFRPFAMAAGARHVILAGGVPAERAEVALLAPTGDVQSRKVVGDDVAYALAATDSIAILGLADGTVQTYRIPTFAPGRALATHNAPCRTVELSPSGRYLATGGRDGLIFVYEFANLDRPLATIADHTAGVECVFFDSDLTLYSGSLDGKVRVHHRNGMMTRTYLDLGGPVVGITRHDGTIVAALRDGTIVELAKQDASTRVRCKTTGPVFAIASTGATLYVGGNGGVRAVE